MSIRHDSTLTLMKPGAPFFRIDIIYTIYLDVIYFSVVCLSLYYVKLTVKTTLRTIGHFFANKLIFFSVRHNLKFNRVEMLLFKLGLKIFNLCFLYIQYVVTRNKFTSFRHWKLETLTLLTVK